jgi:hypothetical protein
MTVTPGVTGFVLAALIVFAAPLAGYGQQFVCWPIARGDTASRLAMRHTGSLTTLYTDWFQIRDPSRRTFVPKSQYERLSTHWQACVARELIPREPFPVVPPPLPQQASNYDMTLVWRVGVAVTVALFACSMVVRFVPDRAIPPDMQYAGEQFVKAFLRPLVDEGCSVPPIRARLRFVRHAEQLEVCLAPNGGRRYPNLSDHKRNVEYDVQRVARLLGRHVVVSAAPRAEGKWVVVAIRRAHARQAGVK